MLDILGKL
nr:unnamed protein product [Callosobruchus analis]